MTDISFFPDEDTALAVHCSWIIQEQLGNGGPLSYFVKKTKPREYLSEGLGENLDHLNHRQPQQGDIAIIKTASKLTHKHTSISDQLDQCSIFSPSNTLLPAAFMTPFRICLTCLHPSIPTASIVSK